jgi:hypothetical protein
MEGVAMQEQSIRVTIASEYPKVRCFLKEITEAQDKVFIVGHAENTTRALTLAGNLRPNVAIIDCYLPHIAGVATVPLSRISGLAISEEIPNTRVVLLSNLDAEVLPEQGLGPDNVGLFSRKTNASNTPFTRQKLYQEVASPSALVFANIEVKQTAGVRQKAAQTSDKAILFFGGLTALAGLALMLTMALAGAGFVLGLAEGATMRPLRSDGESGSFILAQGAAQRKHLASDF